VEILFFGVPLKNFARGLMIVLVLSTIYTKLDELTLGVGFGLDG
jgi:hypothetical protein